MQCFSWLFNKDIHAEYRAVIKYQVFFSRRKVAVCKAEEVNTGVFKHLWAAIAQSV